MPSPFNNPEGGSLNEARPSEEETETITGELWCEECFKPSLEGTYHRSAKRLFWTCVECGVVNAVKGVEL